MDIIIVGAGMAGLSCAVQLHEEGHNIRILEASDGPGGRVRSDRMDGFILDRGFQVYPEAYPAASELLDLKSLDLHAFDSGALIRNAESTLPLLDPFRHPFSALTAWRHPTGNKMDKLRIAALRSRLMDASVEDIWTAEETTTRDYLAKADFSDEMIRDFFQPFYGGIFLEDELNTSSRMFEFVFKMFAHGAACLPGNGMQAIPEQLLSRLPDEAVRFNTRVTGITPTIVSTANGETNADYIVVATDGSTASELGGTPAPDWNGTTCIYFSAPEPPYTDRLITLNATGTGRIRNVCVPSVINPNYAPADRSLISVSITGGVDESVGEDAVRNELVEWFGTSAAQWEHLRTYHIPHSLPVAPAGHTSAPREANEILYCGDYLASASIEGAVVSGLKAAEAILQRA